MTDPTQTLTTATQVIDQLAEQTKQAVTSYGPDAYTLAISYIHWTALFNTFVDAAWMIIALVTIIMSLITFIKFFDKDYHDFQFVFLLVLPIIVGSAVFFNCFQDLISVQNLMGLFAPKLGLVNHVLSALTPASN